MRQRLMHRGRCLLALGLVLALAGCGGRPMKFPEPESELGDRPGLFTGESGAWTFDAPAPRPPAAKGGL